MYVHVVAAPDVSTRYACLLFLVPVSAGYPSPADDSLDGSLDLNQHLIKHPTATFFVRVAGESMHEAGIHSGDVLIVDRALTPSDGSVIIAVVNGELTVKRLSKRHGQAHAGTREQPVSAFSRLRRPPPLRYGALSPMSFIVCDSQDETSRCKPSLP